MLDRTITLRLRYVVSKPDGEIVKSDRCEAQGTDAIKRSIVGEMENELFPITRGTVPGPSGVRRFLGPAVAGAAAVVSAYLLFSLRSESNSGS
jgi:hypothetical protein